MIIGILEDKHIVKIFLIKVIYHFGASFLSEILTFLSDLDKEGQCLGQQLSGWCYVQDLLANSALNVSNVKPSKSRWSIDRSVGRSVNQSSQSFNHLIDH